MYDPHISLTLSVYFSATIVPSLSFVMHDLIQFPHNYMSPSHRSSSSPELALAITSNRAVQGLITLAGVSQLANSPTHSYAPPQQVPTSPLPLQIASIVFLRGAHCMPSSVPEFHTFSFLLFSFSFYYYFWSNSGISFTCDCGD